MAARSIPLNFPSCPLCRLWLILTFTSAHPIRPAACRSMPSTPGRYGSKSLDSSWGREVSILNSDQFLGCFFVPLLSFVVDFDLHFCPPHPRRHPSLANRNSLSDGHILA